MKRKNLLLGTAGLATVSAVLMLSFIGFEKENASYSKNDLSVFDKQNANDAKKWLAARYFDAATGQKITPERIAEIFAEQKLSKRADFISFEELGPDNIGGRTRAILPDKMNPDRVYAGGVSGGLFVSNDRAQTWARIDEFIGLPFISSMTQTQDGTILVATGSNDDDWNGNGMFYKTTTGDWTLVPGTDVAADFFAITEVVCADNSNTVYFTTPKGLRKWTVGASAVETVDTGGSGDCKAVQISKDGMVIVAAMAGSRTYSSEDGGNTFTPVFGTVDNNLLPVSAPRIEFAISPNKNANNKYTVYASRTDGNLLGMYASLDNGMTWSQIAGNSDGSTNLDIYRDQGTYNSILSVDPRNTERLLIGGIDVWDWNQTTNNPVYGGYEKLSNWFLDPTNEKYVHADNHEMKWDNTNRLYIGNDGGVGITDDFGANFYPANRGYNVTQFYGIAMDRDGRVMGGTQDNGTLYNPFIFNSYKNFIEVNGGDGFECEISFFNPKVMFSTIYSGALYRSGDNGYSFSDFTPTGIPGVNWGTYAQSFHTEFVMAEYYDENSHDSVTLYPRQNYNVGDVIKVPSMATGDTIMYVTNKKLYYSDVVNFDPTKTRVDFKVTSTTSSTLIDLGQSAFTIVTDVAPTGVSVNDVITVNGNTITIATATSYMHYFGTSPNPNDPKTIDMLEEVEVFEIPWDTVQVQDPFQSWLIVHTPQGTGELIATRDALRLSKETTWIRLATGVGGNNGFESIDIEFSKDLNKCYISCGNGVWRIDGLGDMYEQDYETGNLTTTQVAAAFRTACTAVGATKIRITTAACEGIALNPTNDKDLVILQQYAAGQAQIKRTLNADVTAPTFTSLRSLNRPAYDAIIDRNNSNIIVIGTAFGAVASNNGGNAADPDTWQDASTGFNNVPVFEVRQNWRTWEEGCSKPGEIYLGTFGRGIWASTSLLGLIDKNDSDAIKQLKTNLKVYPNPTTDYTKLNFTLYKTSDVQVNVYNLSGRLVKTISDKNVGKGNQSIDIDATDLINGSYIIKFQAGTISETIKFMKL